MGGRGCDGWGNGTGGWGYSPEGRQSPDPALATLLEGGQAAGLAVQGGGGEWDKMGREPVPPLEGSSLSSSGSDTIPEGKDRVKGDRRDRASHLRLCHLNVTHWGDAVEGMLEDPDFEIGLFCEMKLTSEQSRRLRKRLRASGWTSVVHPAVRKSRCELEQEQLLMNAGAGGTSSATWGPTQWTT